MTKYPSLANLVKQILCVPVKSAPVERVFSHSGVIVRPHRSSLAPQRLHKILFLKCSKHVFASETAHSILEEKRKHFGLFDDKNSKNIGIECQLQSIFCNHYNSVRVTPTDTYNTIDFEKKEVFTLTEVAVAIRGLKSGKTPGEDEI